MTLNTPEIRQQTLRDRLNTGAQLVAADLAREFDVSLDTIRRDLAALSQSGHARQVRGGAVPIACPSPPLLSRIDQPDPGRMAIAKAIAARLADATTVIIDGGTTPLMTLRYLQPLPDRLIITPSPYAATLAAERGMAVHMIGGRLSPSGGVNVGAEALSDTSRLSADIAVIGACGFDTEFGLSADDFDEATLKRHLATRARTVFASVAQDKFGLRARHQTLAPGGIDLILTDAARTRDIGLTETEILHV